MNVFENSLPFQPRIVVVDDDPGIVALVAGLLQKGLGDHLTIHRTVNPAEAMGLCIAGETHICFADLDMPDMNGFGLLRQIKTHNPLTQLAILTAHPSENALRSAFALGANDYLLKPISKTQLIDCAKFMLNRATRLWYEVLVKQSPLVREELDGMS